RVAQDASQIMGGLDHHRRIQLITRVREEAAMAYRICFSGLVAFVEYHDPKLVQLRSGCPSRTASATPSRPFISIPIRPCGATVRCVGSAIRGSETPARTGLPAATTGSSTNPRG